MKSELDNTYLVELVS